MPSALVLGSAQPARAEDGDLPKTGREYPGDRQSNCEGHPLAEEVGMSYQRVEGVVSGARADASDEQAGLGIAIPRGKGMDPRG